jgi:hypothetical protein
VEEADTSTTKQDTRHRLEELALVDTFIQDHEAASAD